MKKILATIISAFYLVSLVPALASAQASLGTPASMYYSPASGQITIDATTRQFTTAVMVNTGGANSSGADAIVTFSTSDLEYVSGSYPTTGALFPNVITSLPSATTANSTGRMTMSRSIYVPAEGETPSYSTGSGSFVNLTFKVKSGVTTTTLDFDFTLGDTTDSNVAGETVGSDILGSAIPATYTFVVGGSNENETDPRITTIVPKSGDEDTETQLVIYGENFGIEDGRVYIGTRRADVISWAEEEITVIVPAISVNKDTQYQVKVVRTDEKFATYMGFTIVDTGLATLIWMGLIPINGAAAILIKRRWFNKKDLAEAGEVVPIEIVG